ncbi:hypothetical protein L1889_05070 [Paenalcaligenes niemegkensis]|uniref:PQQ-binding-like beta-propeller repeat protein n=1 Tax=Paenalcaligenes niemegkensis TaxID=2895469 RepID=UPI001EE8FD03|nr:PQQ-binding-like beta-propeller repeat protein [Paenalcaligenes niemegkensis]MCQ9616149.1 hypothetical protein [Paenalcaligenes niemegkensis]
MKTRHLLLATSAAVLFALSSHAQQVENYKPVSDQEILAPAAEDWLMWRRTVDNQAFSPLDQINKENVNQLSLKWSWSMPIGGLQETAPLVRDGVMFLGMNRGIVQALDATTGDLIWEYRQELPEFTGATTMRRPIASVTHSRFIKTRST